MRQNLINESKPTWFHNCFVSNNHHHHEMKLPCQNVWQFLDLKRCFGLSFAELNLQSFISESPPLSLSFTGMYVYAYVCPGVCTLARTHTHTHVSVRLCVWCEGTHVGGCACMPMQVSAESRGWCWVSSYTVLCFIYELVSPWTTDLRLMPVQRSSLHWESPLLSWTLGLQFSAPPTQPSRWS